MCSKVLSPLPPSRISSLITDTHDNPPQPTRGFSPLECFFSCCDPVEDLVTVTCKSLEEKENLLGMGVQSVGFERKDTPPHPKGVFCVGKCFNRYVFAGGNIGDIS